MSEEVHLPASVKVGYRVYRIEHWAPRSAAGSNRYGECSHAENVIRVDLSYGLVKAANTLLHELLHACCFVMRFDDKDDEERTVGALSNALTGIWVDNPDVIAWIDFALKSGDH